MISFLPPWTEDPFLDKNNLGRVKRIWYLSPMRAAKVQASPRSLARTSAARSYKQWVKRNLQDRKPDPWPLWMAGHAQLKFVMTECSKTLIRLTGLIWWWAKSACNAFKESYAFSAFLNFVTWLRCMLHFPQFVAVLLFWNLLYNMRFLYTALRSSS